MHSLAAKIISLSALFLVTFIAGLLPLKLRRKREDDDEHRWALRDLRRKQLVSLCTCFAGGAFFASSMLELLPTVQEDFKAVFKSASIKMQYPIAEFGISIGFFLILTVEQIIHVLKEKSPHGHGHSHGNMKDSSTDPLLQDGPTSDYGLGGSPSHQRERESGESDSDEDQPPSDVALGVNGQQISPPKLQNEQHAKNKVNKSSDQEHDQNIFANIKKKHHNHRHYLRSYLLLTALSVHALFEGLAVGLFQDIDSMVQLLGALIIHKCILGFSLGINLVQHSFPASMVARSSFLFAAMSPVGVGIGILMLTYASTSLGRIFSAIFQAIATGTFLYVTFFEIFFHELNSKECHRMLKVLSIVLGYSLIAVVQYFQNRME